MASWRVAAARFVPSSAIEPRRFYELSNGGCYLAPGYDGALLLPAAGASFPPSLSSDAVGIVASLLAFRIVSSHGARFHYLMLLQYAREHVERAAIGAAVLQYVQPQSRGDSGAYRA